MGRRRFGPSHPDWAKTLRAVDLRAQGATLAEMEEETGVKSRTIQTRLRLYDEYEGRDPAIQAGMDAIGTHMVPQHMWAKTKNEDGTSYSVFLKPDPLPDDTLQRIRDAFEGMQPAKVAPPPKQVNKDLLTLYPIFDAHIGMLAWGKETRAEDYDLEIATKQIQTALGKVMAITPDSEYAILLIGGDFFHTDDTRNETPASKHRLDADGRFPKILEAGVTIAAWAIDALLRKHNNIHVRVLRGNHDEHSHHVVNFALAERYRNDPRCFVEKGADTDLLMKQWGKCAIFAHHGDRRFKPETASLYVSDVCKFWSKTRYRHFFTGHVHHAQSKDTGPVKWESLRAFCPPDAYAAQMGYASRRELQAITFDKNDGLVLRAHDPVA